MAKNTKTTRVKQSPSKELLEQRARLLSELRGTTHAAVVARRDEPSDPGDMAEQSHEEWLFLKRNAATTEEARLIDEALKRIEKGTYGVCAECEQPISPKRLAAVPWAKYCIHCEERRGSWTN
jgi:DnaK suppressor protein